MHGEVLVTLSPGQEFHLSTQDAQPLTHEEARRWLDDEFMRLECEPLRASGKVLLADKVLTVASAAGARLLADPAWSAQFARAAVAALARPMVRVDVQAMAVTF
ncbi:hypothetical protein HF896_18345 [Alicycliphilus denitrificans]|jgi:hypothetical protein|uniref:Uncharacterized protein n=2 Tax=Alicycliphilus denitrificans TaxID=179636 RepID=F4GF47_ALIDK|nr:hypothetical protein [Alicycliphilus denitrificans]OJW88061.1 MAG: hypothetical protein BGO66_12730 [Alicycliphilus sp. 69-12]GAO24939.1 hypothetical protein ALISP_4759 [Alicycliphilus sp. B1]ADV01388.1 hypothetical protein Alide_3672 [Alicycliphilus denitrificans BC]AEB86151.1 hypothetical protein Alide2_3826 [Alicycliphilus denitrificans K601]MBN9574817.1 hypothetical protein [Alicycliphilus denitrificans]